MRGISLLAGVAVAAIATPAAAVVTFDDLAEGQRFTSYTTADGIEITNGLPISTTVEQVANGYGLSLLSKLSRAIDGYFIEIQISRAHGLNFSVGAIDFRSIGSDGIIRYSAAGESYSDFGIIELPSSMQFTTIDFMATPIRSFFLQVYSPTEAVALDNITIAPAVGMVPEPAAWAMMAIGFGIVGAAARRRRPAFA